MRVTVFTAVLMAMGRGTRDEDDTKKDVEVALAMHPYYGSQNKWTFAGNEFKTDTMGQIATDLSGSDFVPTSFNCKEDLCVTMCALHVNVDGDDFHDWDRDEWKYNLLEKETDDFQYRKDSTTTFEKAMQSAWEDKPFGSLAPWDRNRWPRDFAKNTLIWCVDEGWFDLEKAEQKATRDRYAQEQAGKKARRDDFLNSIPDVKASFELVLEKKDGSEVHCPRKFMKESLPYQTKSVQQCADATQNNGGSVFQVRHGIGGWQGDCEILKEECLDVQNVDAVHGANWKIYQLTGN